MGTGALAIIHTDIADSADTKQSAYPTNPLVIIFYNQNQENPLCQRQGAKALCRLWGDGL